MSHSQRYLKSVISLSAWYAFIQTTHKSQCLFQPSQNLLQKKYQCDSLHLKLIYSDIFNVKTGHITQRLEHFYIYNTLGGKKANLPVIYLNILVSLRVVHEPHEL